MNENTDNQQKEFEETYEAIFNKPKSEQTVKEHMMTELALEYIKSGKYEAKQVAEIVTVEVCSFAYFFTVNDIDCNK